MAKKEQSPPENFSKLFALKIDCSCVDGDVQRGTLKGKFWKRELNYFVSWFLKTCMRNPC